MTMRHVLDMRRLLTNHCHRTYSNEIDEFALILRIGGEMQEFDFEGCERIRRNRKARYITAELSFPSARWKTAGDVGVRSYIADAVETGLLCLIGRLERDKSQIDSAILMRDFAEAKNAFLFPEVRQA